MAKNVSEQELKNASEEVKTTKRNLAGIWGKVLAIVAIGMSLFQFSLAGMGGMTPLLLRALHLAFAATIVFLLFPARKGAPKARPSIVDFVCIVTIWAAALYLVYSFKELAFRAGNASQWDVIFGIIACLITLEITRRTTGLILTVIGAFFLVYAYFGPYFPGLFAHRGYNIAKIASTMFTTTDGLYGVTLGVSSTYIFFFILFGGFLESMGAGKFFIDFAYSLAGRLKGGPAQTVVVANGLMATISGVPAACVVTIGPFTFPLLNQLGYDKYFSAGLSAVAASGAMITPPVMGSAAFIMAEMTGLTYREICLAAAIPAVLFYGAMFSVTHFYASKNSMEATPRDQLPKTFAILKTGWFNIVPIAVLIYLLIIEGISPMLSGYYAIWAMLIVSLLQILLSGGDKKQGLKEYGRNIVKALKSSAISAVPVVATCAVAGFLVGVLNMTGLGLKFSAIMIQAAQGNLFLALLMSALASIILGMGLPVAACYIILAVLVAPALVQMGLAPMAAHLFILFFGAFSAITPPVAIAAYAAAAMQKIDPIKTGIEACRLGLPAFLIPFLFAYGPPLLMAGTTVDIIIAAITGLIGVIAMSGAIIGYFMGNTNMIQRVLYFVGSILLMIPGLLTDGIGLVIILVCFVWQKQGISAKRGVPMN